MVQPASKRLVTEETLVEQVRDIVGATLVSGSGIDLDVDDSGNTITISNSADAEAFGWYFPENYESVGDGIADDVIPLQNTYDAAYAAGGGLVVLSKKYGWTGDLIQKTGVSVMGFGFADFALADIGLVALDGTARYRYGLQAGHPYVGSLTNIQIDGNGVGGATQLVRVEAVNGAMRDVAIANGVGNGIELAGAQNNSIDHVTCGGFPNGAAILIDNRDNMPSQNPNTQGAGGNKITSSYFHTAMVLIRQTYNSNGHTNGFYAHDNMFIGCLFEQYQDDVYSICHIADGEILFTNCVFTGSSGLLTSAADAVIFVENQLRPTSSTTATFNNCYLGGGAVGVSNVVRSKSYGLSNIITFTGRTSVANANKVGSFFLCSDVGSGGGDSLFRIDGPVDGVINNIGFCHGANGGTNNGLLNQSRIGRRFSMGGGDPNPIQIRRDTDTAANRFQITRDGNLQWFDPSGASPSSYKGSIARSGSGLIISGSQDNLGGVLMQMAWSITSGRPDPTTVPRFMMLDITLQKPIWSDGTVWRDFAGNAV